MKFLGERFLVQDAQNRVFSVDGRHDGNAEIDEAALVADPEAPVLRHAALGDIQFAHDLDARNNRGEPVLGNRRHGMNQHAVNPVLDGNFDVPGLDVNVGGAPFERRKDHGVHQANDRADRGILLRQAVGGNVRIGFFILLDHRQREGFGGLVENALGLLGALQEIADLGGRGDLQDQFLAQQQRQFVAEQNLARIGHCDHQGAALSLHRHKVESEHQLGGNAAKQLRIDPLFEQIDESAAVSFRQAPRLFALALRIGCSR